MLPGGSSEITLSNQHWLTNLFMDSCYTLPRIISIKHICAIPNTGDYVTLSPLFSITQPVNQFIFNTWETPQRFCSSFRGCTHPTGILTGGSWKKTKLHCFGVPLSNMQAYQSTHAELYFFGIPYSEIHLEYNQRGHILLSYSTSVESFLLMVQCHRMTHGYVLHIHVIILI